MEQRTLKLREATPEMVADGLDQFTARLARPIGWDQVLETARKALRKREGLGEVTEPHDWLRLPRGRTVRVLAVFSDDPSSVVIRWADTSEVEVVSVLGGTTHEDLVGRGDLGRELKAGYVEVDSRGSTVTVTS